MCLNDSPLKDRKWVSESPTAVLKNKEQYQQVVNKASHVHPAVHDPIMAAGKGQRSFIGCDPDNQAVAQLSIFFFIMMFSAGILEHLTDHLSQKVIFFKSERCANTVLSSFEVAEIFWGEGLQVVVKRYFLWSTFAQ